MSYESEVDWNTNTRILVRNSEDEPWINRYFAKYNNGTFYAFHGGATSWTTNIVIPWKYAKLAKEDE